MADLETVREVIAEYLLETSPRRIAFARAKVAVRLADLVEYTSGDIKKRSKKCKPALRKADTKNHRWTFAVTCTKDPHTVKVKAVKGKGGTVDKSEVEVSCSCKAWRYYGSDFNAKFNRYLEGKAKSNGQAPDIRDPDRVHLICKHVAACVPMVKGYVMDRLPSKKPAK